MTYRNASSQGGGPKPRGRMKVARRFERVSRTKKLIIMDKKLGIDQKV